MSVCASGDARHRIGDIIYVWGDGPDAVAAVLSVSGEGNATCWLNKGVVRGAECYWIMRWAWHNVAAGWRFTTVRTNDLLALRVA